MSLHPWSNAVSLPGPSSHYKKLSYGSAQPTCWFIAILTQAGKQKLVKREQNVVSVKCQMSSLLMESSKTFLPESLPVGAAAFSA